MDLSGTPTTPCQRHPHTLPHHRLPLQPRRQLGSSRATSLPSTRTSDTILQSWFTLVRTARGFRLPPTLHYTMSSPSALRILQIQPFITHEQWNNHRYNKDIPSPPTYGPELSEVRIIPRTQTHRRSTAPRRPRSITPVRREHDNRPQNLVPDEPRSYTPPVRTQEPASSHRTHSANRNKIGPVAAHEAAPPPPPQHYIPPTESLTQRHFHFHGHDPWAEEVDSDGLEFPPPDLTFDRPLPRPQTTQSVDAQLLPPLRTLVNTQNYQPVTGSDQSYFVGEIPHIYMRHLYPTSPGEVSLNNPRRTSWQLPSDILHQLNRANIQHPTNPTQRSITPWGLFTRMQMHNAAGHFTHSEQALTIPFATQTASPELAIIQWPAALCICILVKSPHGVIDRCVGLVGCWMLALLSWCRMSLGNCQLVRRGLLSETSPGEVGYRCRM